MRDADRTALPPHPRSPQRLLAQWLGERASDVGAVPIDQRDPIDSAALQRAQHGYRASLIEELAPVPAAARSPRWHWSLVLLVAALLVALLAPTGLARWTIVVALLLAALLLVVLHRPRRTPALPGAAIAAQFECAVNGAEPPAVVAPAIEQLRIQLAALLPRLDAAVQSGRPSIDERHALNAALVRDLPEALRRHRALHGSAAAGEADRLLNKQLNSLLVRIQQIDAALAAPLLAAARRHARVLADRR